MTNPIGALRFAHGEMNQAQPADRIGVTRQTVIAIEQGRYSPSLEVAFQIPAPGLLTTCLPRRPREDLASRGPPSRETGVSHRRPTRYRPASPRKTTPPWPPRRPPGHPDQDRDDHEDRDDPRARTPPSVPASPGPGDEVYGTCYGSYAEDARAHQDKLAPEPASLRFAQAATVPVSGCAAPRGPRDAGRLTTGQLPKHGQASAGDAWRAVASHLPTIIGVGMTVIASPPGKRTLGMAALAMFVAAANLRPAIAAVSPLVDRIRADLDLTATGVALLTAAPTPAMGLCAPLAAATGRRFGLHHGVLLGLIVIAVATAARLAGGSTWLQLSCATAVGAGIAIAQTLLPAVVKSRFADRAGLATGIYTAGLGTGGAVAAGVSAPLADYLGSWPRALASWSALALAGTAGCWNSTRPAVRPHLGRGRAALGDPPRGRRQPADSLTHVFATDSARPASPPRSRPCSTAGRCPPRATGRGCTRSTWPSSA